MILLTFELVVLIMDNMYWPVYKNIEREFLKIAEYINICDEQLKVYSFHIADLIIRCAIEIEAISKELYKRLGGNMNPVDENGKTRDLYFDTDCLGLLEEKWGISKKKVKVSALEVFLTREENIILTPLKKSNKRGSSGSQWKKAYQALKHDRRNSLKCATIENLISSMAALFILNLYYKDETSDLGRLYMNDRTFDSRAGSDIFNAYVVSATTLRMELEMDDLNIINIDEEKRKESIFIIKYTDSTYREMHRAFCLDYYETKSNFDKSEVIQKYVAEHPESKEKSMNENCIEAGGHELLCNIFVNRHSLNSKNYRTEVIVNKNEDIYQKLKYID